MNSDLLKRITDAMRASALAVLERKTAAGDLERSVPLMKKTKYPLRAGFKRVSGLFAFWRYDLFPYVLGGAVMAMDAAGRIQAESYAGSAFHPIKIMPRDAGFALQNKIETLRQEYRVAEREFRDEWVEKICALIREARPGSKSDMINHGERRG